MSIFNIIKRDFGANWATVLAGWTGLGVFSSWPDRWGDFPPLLSIQEIKNFAEESILLSVNDECTGLLYNIISLNMDVASREEIRDIVKAVACLDESNIDLEMRKWRLVMLEDILSKISYDPIYGAIEVKEFWSSFGFPGDVPSGLWGTAGQEVFNQSEADQNKKWRDMLANNTDWARNERILIDKTVK